MCEETPTSVGHCAYMYIYIVYTHKIIALRDLTVLALGSHAQVMKFYFKPNASKKKIRVNRKVNFF